MNKAREFDQSVVAELKTLLGERVSTSPAVREHHGKDESYFPYALPDAVVFVKTTEEVRDVVDICRRHRVPMIPYGVGTSLEGHILAVQGGVCIDLSQMNQVLAVHESDLDAVVQAGVTRKQLNEFIKHTGLFFPVDPGADATLGGMAATNAAGTTTVRYGKMRANVLALEAVLPDGHVVRTGSRAAKTSAGYDLTGLLLGSEGTLAVITELTLRLRPIPEHAGVMRISFPTVEAACSTAADAVAAGAGVTRLELLDPWTVAAVNHYSGTSYPEIPCLFVESTGSRGMVEADLALVEDMARAHGATELTTEQDPDERTRLWRARHDAAHAAAAYRPGTRERTTDVCVPLTELAAAVRVARYELDRVGLEGGIFGHAGDGNLHVNIRVHPDDPDSLARSDELVRSLVADALARGGTCTGEHGIGAGKIAALALEHPDLVPLYRAVKEAFDPPGILNPGKVVS
jgi:D-lactate dehydrogenase (cytochrome)